MSGGLGDVMRAVERGEFPPADGSVLVVPQDGPLPGVFAFTAFNVIAADVDPDWVYAQLPEGDLAAPLGPSFLTALGARLSRRVHVIDQAMIAHARPDTSPPPGLTEVAVPDVDHPRVRRAERYRRDFRVWAVEGGLVLLGHGVAGRWEVAFEVEPSHRGRGLGRRLAAAALTLVPPGAAVWAQVSPGNVASVRALLAAGYRPVGAEALLA